MNNQNVSKDTGTIDTEFIFQWKKTSMEISGLFLRAAHIVQWSNLSQNNPSFYLNIIVRHLMYFRCQSCVFTKKKVVISRQYAFIIQFTFYVFRAYTLYRAAL